MKFHNLEVMVVQATNGSVHQSHGRAGILLTYVVRVIPPEGVTPFKAVPSTGYLSASDLEGWPCVMVKGRMRPSTDVRPTHADVSPVS
jgi:hypothetical protein